jgi:hypothetical protein
MDKEETKDSCCEGWKRHHHHHRGGAGGGAVYCLGVIGALFYYLPHCVTFSDYALGIGKSLVWPALLIFKALTMLKM